MAKKIWRGVGIFPKGSNFLGGIWVSGKIRVWLLASTPAIEPVAKEAAQDQQQGAIQPQPKLQICVSIILAMRDVCVVPKVEWHADGWETLDSFDALDIAMINDLTDAEFEIEALRCIRKWNAAAPATWLYEFISLA